MVSTAQTEKDQAQAFTGFPVKIEIFEGPLDLLLHLVRRQEVEIAEVQVSSITDDYLRYLETLQAVNVDLASDFIVLAANLMWLKSRVLLPRREQPEQTQQDEEDLFASEEELREKLEEYKAYREAANLLAESQKMRQRVFLRPLSGDDDIGSGFVPIADVSLFDMVAALEEMLARTRETPPAIVRTPEITVADCIDSVLLRLQGVGERSCNFVDLVEAPVSRTMVVLIFLAVLELIRRRRVNVSHGTEARQLVVSLLE
jgi:segregation and condensation protein A